MEVEKVSEKISDCREFGPFRSVVDALCDQLVILLKNIMIILTR